MNCGRMWSLYCHDLNDCGEKLYDGSAKDQSCPKRDE